MNDEIEWNPDKMLEVTIKQPDDFLKVRETLTRIGVASRKDKTLYQSCHILHKQGKYFIVHFKELFALDGKTATLSENDIQRRNTIAILLQDWNLIDITKKDSWIDVNWDIYNTSISKDIDFFFNDFFYRRFFSFILKFFLWFQFF